MTVNGVPQADIAKAMQLDPKTLRKCYRESLDNATIVLCARVARHLGTIATTGRGAAAVSACRYILGRKANWKDTTHVEIEPSPDTIAYFTGESQSADVRQRILDKLAAIRANNDKIEAIRAGDEPDLCEVDKGTPEPEA